MKRFLSVFLLISLLCCLIGCKKEETIAVDPSASHEKADYFEDEKNHTSENATVTENAVYWEDDGTIYHCPLEGGKETEIAKGRLGSAVGEFIYFTADGTKQAYDGQKTITIPGGQGYATEEGLLLYEGTTLSLLDREDPNQKKQYPHPVEGLENYVTLKDDVLYWFGKNALQKTDLQSGKTETLQELGYIGTSIPSFYWFGEQLYFYYGYTVYRCEKDQVTAVVAYKENTTCVFGNGYAYVSEPGAPHATILDLQSDSVVRTIKAAGFGANQWGVAYRSDNHIVIESEEELRIPIPEGTELIGSCYATPNGALVNTAEKFIHVYRTEDGEWNFSRL